MNYFNRLAQRTGIGSPGGVSAPIAAPAGPGIAPSADAIAIEQMIEVAAPPSARLVTGAASLHPATSLSTVPAEIPHEASVSHGRAATAPVTETEGWVREEEHIHQASTPVRPGVLAREMPSHASLPIAANTPSSQGDANTPSNVSARFLKGAKPTAAAALASEVSLQGDTTPATLPDVKRQIPAVTDRRAPNARAGLRSLEAGPSVNEEIVLETPVVSIAGRTREERDGIRRQHDRAATIDRRPRAEERTRGGSVEVRIGTVTLQVHAAPPAVPARSSFAPHRHYLRLW